MNSIDRFLELKAKIPANVEIVAVSKNRPANMIDELYRLTGHSVFGENKAMELAEKYNGLTQSLHWHFIGHLQTNKIKYIAPFVDLIQSVDSLRLLIEINKTAINNNRVIPCLLQIHIASEETKYGFSIDEIYSMYDDKNFHELSNVSIRGVMGMATFTSDGQQIKKEFRSLVQFYNILKSRYFTDHADFCEVSMGMTNDYQIAIDEGSTIIRIGSGIFDER